MSKKMFIDTIKKVFESAGFKIKKYENTKLQIETDIKDTYTEIDIIYNEGYVYFQVPGKPIAPDYGVNPKQFWMDWDEEMLKKSYSGVYRKDSTITIEREDCKLVIFYSEKGLICDFQCHKSRKLIPWSCMGSNIGSECDTIYDEPICARVEDAWGDYWDVSFLYRTNAS